MGRGGGSGGEALTFGVGTGILGFGGTLLALRDRGGITGAVTCELPPADTAVFNRCAGSAIEVAGRAGIVGATLVSPNPEEAAVGEASAVGGGEDKETPRTSKMAAALSLSRRSFLRIPAILKNAFHSAEQLLKSNPPSAVVPMWEVCSTF